MMTLPHEVRDDGSWASPESLTTTRKEYAAPQQDEDKCVKVCYLHWARVAGNGEKEGRFPVDPTSIY